MGIVLLLRRGSCRPAPRSGRCRVVVFYHTPGRRQVRRPRVLGRPPSARLRAEGMPAVQFIPFRLDLLYSYQNSMSTPNCNFPPSFLSPRSKLERAPSRAAFLLSSPPDRLSRLLHGSGSPPAGLARAAGGAVMPRPEFSPMIGGHTMVLSRSPRPG